MAGITPEGTNVFWNGTGWVKNTRKTFYESEADAVEREINREGVFVAYRVRHDVDCMDAI